ncbi:MAG: EGF domain-containing protein [Polyangiaceae bacterium]
MKLTYRWMMAAVLAVIGCGTPEEGGVRGFFAEGGTPPPVKTCKDLTCDPNATCEETATDAVCTCSAGFTGDGKSCTDVDECAAPGGSDCSPQAECINRPGSYSCKCKDGYVGDGKTCTSIQVCGGAANVCDPNATCADTNPGFSCTCKSGFRGDGLACADIDECQDNTFSCAANAACVNTYGGFSCACKPGYSGDGNTACRGLCDVAKMDLSVCAPEALCHVVGQRAVCDACKPGYSGDGKTCEMKTCPAACDGTGTDDAAHAVCQSDGTCGCAPGYSGSAGSCTDVDECATNNGGCGANAACTNTDGGHLCACKAGYAANASGQCVDIDECKAATGPCHPDAICTNHTPEETTKGYVCQCKPGFTGDGLSCRDIDECANGGNCAVNATCINQRGSSSCACTPPLVGDPRNCHCDLSGLWAVRLDVDLCWKGRPIQVGTSQDLVSPGSMEATNWELREIAYDGEELKMKMKSCGGDNTPDLISPLFRETYSSYVPLTTFDLVPLRDTPRFNQPSLVPGSRFNTPTEADVYGIDLGADPVNAMWPANRDAVDPSKWTDPDNDGRPGVTFWSRMPSETTDSGTGRYKYLPVRPSGGGTSFSVDQRAACVSTATRVLSHMEARVDSCNRIVGTYINEKSEGRVNACTVVDKGTCSPTDPNDCSGWSKDVGCTSNDWRNAQLCDAEMVKRLDDDQNQSQSAKATFEAVRIMAPSATCTDVRAVLPSFDRSTPTITCTTPP